MAAKPRVRRKTPARIGKSKMVSFRLDRQLVEQIDGIAERFDVARNNIVALVLYEYINERGTSAVTDLIERQAASAGQIDLFS